LRWRRGFYRPRLGSNVLFDGLVALVCAAWAAGLKLMHHPKTKNPAGFQASRVLENSMIFAGS
jgi:hypothetical protein